MTNMLQFDKLLGGTEDLPPDISVRKFVSARAQEIAALTQAIEDPQGTSLIFQKLPKHMRRRVMSRTSKRLPRRLREAHLQQLRKSGLPPKHKRPSRKFRRRPRNLLLEYNRRQKKFVWLETHLWHAKRFHMVEKWGYKLPNAPNDKSFRACYRATANHCLLQDISYYCCVELKGPIGYLLEKLQMLTSKECGFTFGAKIYLDGTREGSVMLFRPNIFPYGAIGRVHFLWKPIVEVKSEGHVQENEHRTLWIWVHPSYYQEVLDALIVLFSFTEMDNPEDSALNKVIFPSEVIEMFSENHSTSDVETPEESTQSPAKKKRKLAVKRDKAKNVEETKLATRNVPFVRTPKYRSSNGSVEMTLLKDTLNRFRLTGPLSHAVLLESLHVARLANILSNSSKAEEESLDMDVVCLESSDEGGDKAEEDKFWWKRYYSESEENKESCRYQEALWKELKGAASPAQLSPHSVIALTIQDPRLQLPPKRHKAVPDSKALLELHSEHKITTFSPMACQSPIWSPLVRDSATNSKISTAEFVEMRSQNLVPGFNPEEFSFEAEDNTSSSLYSTVQIKSLIPILLIQRPGSQNPSEKRLGYGMGWDVVMPAGWAMPLWLAFVFRGARAGGLRETESLGFEANSETFLAPDTQSGSADAETRRKQLTERYFRLPPNKRPNYIKLGITSPFMCSWNVLVSDWMDTALQSHKTEHTKPSSHTQFFILRERKKLECLKSAVDSLKGKKIRNSRQNVVSTVRLSDFLPDSTSCCLVPVTLHMHGRGNPADHAIICLPLEVDMDNMLRNASFPGPVEDLHVDEHAEERRELQAAHKRLLKSLRRKRVRERLKQEDAEAMKEESRQESEKESDCIASSVKRKLNKEPPTKELTDKHADVMHSLWLPCTRKVKDSCSRTVIGYVTKGDFSFTESQGVCQGYVVLAALLQIVAQCEKRMREGQKLFTPLVLVRNPTNLQYRFGVISIRSM